MYLNDQNAIDRAIKYVQGNPLKEGKPEQRWSFVVRQAVRVPEARPLNMDERNL